MKLLPVLLLASSLLYGSASLSRPEPIRVVNPPWTCRRGDLAGLVEESARAEGIPSWILARLIDAESRWNPDARSKPNKNGTRDLGICQLNSRYLGDFARMFNGGKAIDPMDPYQAVPVAARYLADCYEAVDNWPGAIASYNCGLSRVLSGNVPASTLKYVEKVMGK